MSSKNFVLSYLFVSAISTGAFGRTPACIVKESRTVQCKIEYAAANGDLLDRSLEVARISFQQNPATTEVCASTGPGIFTAQLEGDAQQEVRMIANGFQGDIVEDRELGSFHLMGLHYASNIPQRYRLVSEFPALDLSFREDREQDLEFRIRGKKITARMHCHGAETAGN